MPHITLVSPATLIEGNSRVVVLRPRGSGGRVNEAMGVLKKPQAGAAGGRRVRGEEKRNLRGGMERQAFTEQKNHFTLGVCVCVSHPLIFALASRSSFPASISDAVQCMFVYR